MNATSATADDPDATWSLTKIALLAIVCAFAVANVYYSQPLLPLIAADFRLSIAVGGLVSTLTQAGYALGFCLWLPLADRVPRHRLIPLLLLGNTAANAMCGLAPNFACLVIGCACVGLTAVTGQVILPIAASLVPAEQRGHAVGVLLGGFSVGVVLARTLSGCIGAAFGWRAMFVTAAALDLAVLAVLLPIIPRVAPTTRLRYPALLGSVVTLIRSSWRLRQLSLSSGLMFGAFASFWAGLPFLLHRPPYSYNTASIGMFGFATIPGVFAASQIGRWSDAAGVRRVAISGGLVGCLLCMLAALTGPKGWWPVLFLVAIGLDLSNKCVLVPSQSRIFAIDPTAIGRLNTVFMTVFFGCGAIGSALSAWLTGRYGWPGLAGAGIGLALASTVTSARRERSIPIQAPAL